MKKRKVFFGSYYIRGGLIRDKHGNVYKKPVTYRQTRTGYVVNSKSNWEGQEQPRKHSYGYDPRKRRKPATFVKPNRLGSLKHRRGHVRRL